MHHIWFNSGIFFVGLEQSYLIDTVSVLLTVVTFDFSFSLW